MSSGAFNPYHKWLGIAPEDQPPNHYRLLGVPLFESDPDVISSAADRQMTHVRSFQTGQHSVESQHLLNEISAARVCLLSAEKKHAYDAMLRHEMQAAAAPGPSLAASQRKPRNRRMQIVMVAAGAVAGLIVVGLLLLANGSREPTAALETPGPERAEAKPEVTPQKPEATRQKPDATPEKPEATPQKPEASVQPHSKVEVATAPPAPVAKVPVANVERAAAEAASPPEGSVNRNPTESSGPSGQAPAGAQVAEPPAELPRSSEWVALAPLAQLDGDSAPATWKLAGDTAEYRATRQPASVSVPLRVDGSYDLQFRAAITRYARNSSILLYLPVAQGRAAVLEMKGVYRVPDLTTLELLGLTPAPQATGDVKMEIMKEYAFTCSVAVAGRSVDIQVLRDAQALFAWSGDVAQVRSGPSAFKIESPRKGYDMTARLKDLQVRRRQRGLPRDRENVSSSNVPEEASQAGARALASDAPPGHVPDEASQAKARALVKEVFGEEWTEAKGSPEKSSALAQKLQQTAVESEDAANRYVLLDVARSVSVDAGNVEPALEAVDEMGRSFQIDTAEMKVEVVKSIAANAHLPEQYTAILECIPSLIDEMVIQDSYDEALSVGKVALAVVRKTRDAALVKRAVADNKQIELLARHYETVIKPQLAVLKRNPDAPDANTVVGKYYCDVKGNWTKGLPLLAKCDDPALQALAAKELADRLDAQARVKVADEWWSMAETPPAAARIWWAKTPQILKAHAVTLYEAALPGLAGLEKERVKQRIESGRASAGDHSPIRF